MTTEEALRTAASAILEGDALSRMALADALEECGMVDLAKDVRANFASGLPNRKLLYKVPLSDGTAYEVDIDLNSLIREAVGRARNNNNKRSTLVYKAVTARRVKVRKGGNYR